MVDGEREVAVLVHGLYLPSKAVMYVRGETAKDKYYSQVYIYSALLHVGPGMDGGGFAYMHGGWTLKLPSV